MSIGQSGGNRRIKFETVKKIAALLGLLVALSILSVACYREEDFNLKMMAKDQTVDYDLALPLFETKLTIANLLSVFGREENFPVGEDGLVHLVYALPEPLVVPIGSRIAIPDLMLGSFEMGAIPYWKKDTVISVSQIDTITVEIRGLQEDATLNRIVLDSLMISLSGNYGLGMASSIDIDFSNVRYDGQPLSLHLDLEKGSDLSYDYLYRGVEILFEGGMRERPGIIYEVRLRSDMNTAENEYPDVRTGSVRMRPEFKQIVYDRIEGYIGQFPFDFKDALDVSLLKNLDVEDLSFYGGYMQIISKLKGSSVPINIKKSDLTCVDVTGNVHAVGMYPDNFVLPYPDPSATVLEKDTMQTMSISNLLQHKPVAFNYMIDATINGGGNGTPYNVIERRSGLEMNIACDLPLHMSVKKFVMDDTLPFSGIEQADLIKRFFLKGIVTNAFPLEVYLHMDFLDARGNILFSPVEGDTIAGGHVNADLHVDEPAIYRLDTELSSDEVAMLNDTKSIRVWATISTYNQGEAKIYANSDKEGFLRVKLGARAMLHLGSVIGGLISEDE